MSIFKHGVCANKTMTVALIAEMIILVILIYTPGTPMREF